MDSIVDETDIAPTPSIIPPAPESGVRIIDELVGERHAERAVTLVVYEWDSVEPGVLAWVFPDLALALSAAGAMKNATRWMVVSGARTAPFDVDFERAEGRVLAEALERAV